MAEKPHSSNAQRRLLHTKATFSSPRVQMRIVEFGFNFSYIGLKSTFFKDQIVFFNPNSHKLELFPQRGAGVSAPVHAPPGGSHSSQSGTPRKGPLLLIRQTEASIRKDS